MGRNTNGSGTFQRYQGNKWQCRLLCKYKTELGRPKFATGTGKTKKEAFEIANARKKQYDKMRSAEISIDKSKKGITLRATMLEWLELHSVERQWSGNTKQTRTTNIENMFLKEIGGLKLKAVTTKILNTVFIDMLKDYDRDGVGVVYSLVEQFFSYCESQGYIEDNPFDKVMKLPKKKKTKELSQDDEFDDDDDNYKIFTEDEIQKMFDLVSTMTLNKEMAISLVNPRASIFIVMFLTGMRGQEIRALRLSDIDFDNHTISITKALSVDENKKTIVKETKTKNSKRIISVNAKTEKYLKILIENRLNQDTDLLCPTETGNWIERRNFAHLFDRFLKQCGIEKNGRSPHNLRHTFVSFAIEKNELSPLKDKEMLFISRYVGHADLSTTLDIYTHLQKNKLKDVKYHDDTNIVEIEYE